MEQDRVPACRNISVILILDAVPNVSPTPIAIEPRLASITSVGIHAQECAVSMPNAPFITMPLTALACTVTQETRHVPAI